MVLDEAHKFMNGTKADELSNAIVFIARMMRHDGIRLVVSTQNPEALAPELLELSTIAVLHQFTSPDWFNHLQKKLPLRNAAFDRIAALEQGQAVVYARRHAVKSNTDFSELGTNIFPISIRKRITRDYGFSKTNVN